MYLGGSTDGTVTFSGICTAGSYEARLFFNDGYHNVEASDTFDVVGDCGDPALTMSKDIYGDEPIVVNFSDVPGNTKDWIGLYEKGAGNLTIIAWSYLGGATDGSVTFGSISIDGDYEARLFFADGYTTVEAFAPFIVAGGGGQLEPVVTMSKSEYSTGEQIVVNFSGLPGNALDWIGLYEQSADNLTIVDWWYTDGTTSGTAGITDGSLTFDGISTPGDYEARLFYNNGYTTVEALDTFGVSIP